MTALVLAVLVDVAVVHLGLPLAELLVLAFIFTRLVPQVTRAQSQIQSLAQALPAFNELTSVIDGCDQAAEVAAHPRPAGSPPLLQERLAFDHVSFAYRRADGRPVEVLHDVTVCLPANTTTAVVGPSGAGKTTMADLAVGLLAPSFGQLHIDGTPLTAELLAEWRAAVAMVPQEAFLFHDSVRANLRWAQPQATEAEMWDALTLSSAEAFVRRLPEGLDTVVGDRGGRLSGGERQRMPRWPGVSCGGLRYWCWTRRPTRSTPATRPPYSATPWLSAPRPHDHAGDRPLRRRPCATPTM